MPLHFLSDKMSPEAWSAIMAFILSVLRILGEKENNKITARRLYRMLIEGLTCSFLAVSAIPVVAAFGLSADLNIPVGVFIGYVGSQAIRVTAVALMNRKSGKL